jgi:hypothetical protein
LGTATRAGRHRVEAHRFDDGRAVSAIGRARARERRGREPGPPGGDEGARARPRGGDDPLGGRVRQGPAERRTPRPA